MRHHCCVSLCRLSPLGSLNWGALISCVACVCLNVVAFRAIAIRFLLWLWTICEHSYFLNFVCTMSTSTQRPKILVQKLITLYFTTNISIEMGSLCCQSISETSDSGYVSETLVSKQGNVDFYLGRCNAIDESPKRFLFNSSESIVSYRSTSFNFTPSLSSVRLSSGVSSISCGSVVFRKWCCCRFSRESFWKFHETLILLAFFHTQ